MRTFTSGHPDWLTVVQLPAYVPDLNPVEGAWSSMKSSLGNLATCTIDQLAAIIRNRLGRIQRQPALITALLRQTGLTSNPSRLDTAAADRDLRRGAVARGVRIR